MSSKNYRILSLDISSTCTGWSFVTNRKNSLKYGKIEMSKNEELAEKLTYFKKELTKIIKRYKPTEIVMEDVFLSRNPKVVMILAKFGGVAQQTINELTDQVPFVVSNTTPKSFFKAKKKENLYKIVIDLINIEDSNFKDWNDITDSIAQLLYYCDDILNVRKIREEKEYGFRYYY